jgi:hypothetical protein
MKLRNTIIASALILAATTGGARADIYMCRPCAAGTYSTAGATACKPCDANKYATGMGNTGCTGCPANSTTLGYTGRTSSNDCKCNAGYYKNGAGNCQICAAGTYCTGGGASPTGPCNTTTYSGTGSTRGNASYTFWVKAQFKTRSCKGVFFGKCIDWNSWSSWRDCYHPECPSGPRANVPSECLSGRHCPLPPDEFNKRETRDVQETIYNGCGR